MTDIQAKEEGKVVGFGIGQLSNPTPRWMKSIMRVAAFFSGVWALLPQDLINLSDHNYAYVNKWIIVGNAILLFSIKFFGWKDPNEGQ